MLQVKRLIAVTGFTRTPVALGRVRWWAQNWAQRLSLSKVPELSTERAGVDGDAPDTPLALFIFFIFSVSSHNKLGRKVVVIISNGGTLAAIVTWDVSPRIVS